MFYLKNAKKEPANARIFSALDDLNFRDDIPQILKMEKKLQKYRQTHRLQYRMVFLEILQAQNNILLSNLHQDSERYKEVKDDMIALGAKMKAVNDQILERELDLYGPPGSLSIQKVFEDNPQENSEPLPEYDKKKGEDEKPKVLTDAEQQAMNQRLERQKTLRDQVREANNSLMK